MTILLKSHLFNLTNESPRSYIVLKRKQTMIDQASFMLQHSISNKSTYQWPFNFGILFIRLTQFLQLFKTPCLRHSQTYSAGAGSTMIGSSTGPSWASARGRLSSDHTWLTLSFQNLTTSTWPLCIFSTCFNSNSGGGGCGEFLLTSIAILFRNSRFLCFGLLRFSLFTKKKTKKIL